jgi:hypothetical protein
LPSVFATAIGKPSAALVATALCMGTLHQVMKGTEMKPPPAPTRPDKVPIAPPATKRPAVPGICRCGEGCLLRNICVAEKPTKAAKRNASARPLTSG